jgi:hypothetical protein
MPPPVSDNSTSNSSNDDIDDEARKLGTGESLSLSQGDDKQLFFIPGGERIVLPFLNLITIIIVYVFCRQRYVEDKTSILQLRWMNLACATTAAEATF